MRDPGYPEVTDPDVLAHLNAENAWFEHRMASHKPLVETLFAEMRGAAAADGAGPVGAGLIPAVAALEEATQWMVGASAEDAAAAATPYLKLFGIVTGGWTLARQAAEASARLAAGTGDAGFLKAKLATAQVYADALLPQAAGLAQTAMAGARGLMDVPEDAL